MAPRRVAIIGAGVAGLAAAKYLLAEQYTIDSANQGPCFEVTIFEQRSKVGGVWNYTQPYDKFATPVYDGLETNVPRTLMTYSGFPYPVNTSLFPTHDVVNTYLRNYAVEIAHLIRLNTEVISITPNPVIRDYNKKWAIQIRDIHNKDGIVEQEYYDFVVIATGTFSKPYVPDTIQKDLEKWERLNPGSVIHSKDFRTPNQFADKTVLIVGSGPSSWDIALRISPIAKDVMISRRRNLGADLSDPTTQRVVTGIEKYHSRRKAVRLSNGKYEFGIDKIILCTGYVYTFPFLPNYDDGHLVENLWEHMISIEEPSMAFVGLTKMAATFIMAEAQSAFIAGAFSGRLGRLERPAMRQEEQREIALFNARVAKGQASQNGFHDLGFAIDEPNSFLVPPPQIPRDQAYVHRIYNTAVRALQAPGNLTEGKMPPFISLKLQWLRRHRAKLRNAFMANGVNRHMFPSPESLGFVYLGDGEGTTPS